MMAPPEIEAARRLGVPLLKCPTCWGYFVNSRPRWVVEERACVFRNGREDDWLEHLDELCSQQCARKHQRKVAKVGKLVSLPFISHAAPFARVYWLVRWR